jgi:hypothetical protein
MAMDPNDPRVQEYLRSSQAQQPKPPPRRPKKPAAAPAGKVPDAPTETKQRRLFFKRRRAGVVLSREEVKAIKAGRKKLRKEMKDRGIRSRRDFELTAGSLGLYFDKHRGFLLWLRGHWLGALLGALLALLLVLFIFGAVTQLRGFFTINLSGGLFREGFTLSDDVEFTNPTTQLYAIPAEGVPCISIDQIEERVNETDGGHNRDYFAYTFYVRNEGESTVDYSWSLVMNSESRKLSDAGWALLFVDGVPTVYAKPDPARGTECLPDRGDDTRGYVSVPVLEYYGSEQRELIRTVNGLGYYRVVSEPFEGDWSVASGVCTEVEPMEVHKYTVVLWLEGDDHECTNEKIGGYLGMEMDFRLLEEEEEGTRRPRHSFWENLRFWD